MTPIKLEKIDWNDAAKTALLPALGDAPQQIQAEVEQGIAELFHSEQFGYLVTRYEMRPDYNELVLVAGSGKDLTTIVPVFIQIAKECGADSVRYHSQDWRVAKLFEAIGFKEIERVHRLEIN